MPAYQIVLTRCPHGEGCLRGMELSFTVAHLHRHVHSQSCATSYSHLPLAPCFRLPPNATATIRWISESALDASSAI